jgi:hypothetical protein
MFVVLFGTKKWCNQRIRHETSKPLLTMDGKCPENMWAVLFTTLLSSFQHEHAAELVLEPWMLEDGNMAQLIKNVAWLASNSVATTVFVRCKVPFSHLDPGVQHCVSRISCSSHFDFPEILGDGVATPPVHTIFSHV